MFFDIKFINVASKLDAFHVLCKGRSYCYSTVGPDVLTIQAFFTDILNFCDLPATLAFESSGSRGYYSGSKLSALQSLKALKYLHMHWQFYIAYC